MPSSACNLITFFFIYYVSPNSISNLLLRLHSQNSSFLQNQNQNPFLLCLLPINPTISSTWVFSGDHGVFVDLDAFVELVVCVFVCVFA
ncbi:hypothetical protein F2Q69_00031846 [Brassica cretica]|uniref:Uncharacterized protein n=1 Tax=Brassica cretica TaxID=69181 RepID=A0A8S9RUX2_BRACR|nr:hypothetical protein F2Q69_00031846 [Brassica cretica]